MRNYLLLNILLVIVVNKVEKQLVQDYLERLKETYENDHITLSQRYTDMKKFKLSSNTTIVCINCLSVRHKDSDKLCCDKAPRYDLTTSYRKILSVLQGEENDR